MSKLIEKNTRIYNDFYKNNEIDGWEAVDKRLNFYYLFKIFDKTDIIKNKPTILDVGCGTGDATRYLPIYKYYLGIDIYRPAIQIAKQINKGKNIDFKYGNILTSKFKINEFDFVLCSGALSITLNKRSPKENYEFLSTSLKKMLRFAKTGVAFNVLIDRKNTTSELFYYDFEKVMEIAKEEAKCYENSTVQYENTPLDKLNPQITVWIWK